MIKPRIAGHPLHIILAHFPSAFYPMSVICASVYYFTGNIICAHVAVYTMLAGTATGWMTILFGLWESWFVSINETKVVTTIFWHASFNGVITILFTIWSVKTWNYYPEIIKDSLSLMIIKWAVILLLVAGNFLGGKLLLKYHVGLPEASAPSNRNKT